MATEEEETTGIIDDDARLLVEVRNFQARSSFAQDTTD
jgi:hypothetical protein